ncbi:perlucin-like protein [Ruditapes philippinarum]|uniref:perlucin-like protein n=1 Tax=Ruditapes philippinarum TaxID=129788 RepID=UPI00295B5165|nr:perlucin-like protein [Ruditapes philippinarum]
MRTTGLLGSFVYIFLYVAKCTYGSCPNGWITHDSKCYHFSHDTEPMLLAKLSCQELGGALVEIETATENDYLAAYIRDKQTYYLIGLNDIQEEGNWVWIGSKTQASYINWRPTEPNNGVDENCVVIDGTVGQWNDTPCHLAFNYICEKDSVDSEIVGK